MKDVTVYGTPTGNDATFRRRAHRSMQTQEISWVTHGSGETSLKCPALIDTGADWSLIDYTMTTQELVSLKKSHLLTRALGIVGR